MFAKFFKMDIENLRQSFPDHWNKATAIRMLSVDGVERANSGHPGILWGWQTL